MAQKILNTPGVNYVPLQAETSHMGGVILACDKVKPNSPPLSSLPSPAALYGEAKGQNDPSGGDAWWVDPEALLQTVMAQDPRGTGHFVPQESSDSNSSNSMFVNTIEQYEVPPAVVVGGTKFWVALTGYNTNADGSLNWFMIHDPAFDAGPEAFHAMAATQWSSKFLPVATGTRWKSKYVGVRDPNPQGPEPRPAVRHPRAPGTALIRPVQAIEFAIAELKERGLAEQPKFAQALDCGRPDRPVLVQSLDERQSAYYLISWNADGQTLASVALDARYGDFWSAVAHQPAPPLIRLSPADVIRKVTERPIPIYRTGRSSAQSPRHEHVPARPIGRFQNTGNVLRQRFGPNTGRTCCSGTQSCRDGPVGTGLGRSQQNSCVVAVRQFESTGAVLSSDFREPAALYGCQRWSHVGRGWRHSARPTRLEAPTPGRVNRSRAHGPDQLLHPD
jgi:hypothetical protein